MESNLDRFFFPAVFFLFFLLPPYKFISTQDYTLFLKKLTRVLYYRGKPPITPFKGLKEKQKKIKRKQNYLRCKTKKAACGTKNKIKRQKLLREKASLSIYDVRLKTMPGKASPPAVGGLFL